MLLGFLRSQKKNINTKDKMEKSNSALFGLGSGAKNPKNRSTVLLLDAEGLSHYTSYLAYGLSRYMNVILYGLSLNDYVLTGAAKAKEIQFNNIGEKYPKGNFIVLKLARRLLFFLRVLFKALIKETKYDIVHIQGHLPLFFLFLPILKLKSKQICWTLHDVNLRPSYTGIKAVLELWYMRAVAQPSILEKYTDAIIVHGSLLKKQLVSKGVNQDKIYVIPHFDYMYLVNRINNDQATTPGYNIYSDYLLLFGRIVPYKGINILFDAVRIARRDTKRKFNILIAGKGDLSDFKKLLTKEDYEYIHIYNEFIPSYQIPDLFKKAKFLVLPYTDASQSGIIPLAYTFSKPVVVSNVASLPEYVEHETTGYIFESGNSTQLASYITDLVNNDDKCIEMGKKASQKLLREMSLELCCKIINDIYISNC
jgi:alpha-maltose-1-phosphate synthase